MRIVSWNVNGLRACIEKGFFSFFDAIDADIFCLQEVKMLRSQFTSPVSKYSQHWHSAIRKGYSGVAVFSKKAPVNVFYGINGEFCDEGRLLTLEYENFYLVNCYSPHSQRNLTHLQYKLSFDAMLINYLDELQKNKPVILCGDLNIAHQEIDLKNPKANVKNAGYTIEERNDFNNLLSRGFVDSYRHKYPEKLDIYSWWSYRKGVRERNIGWRLDYMIISQILINLIDECYVFSNIYGSDHCPVGIDIFL